MPVIKHTTVGNTRAKFRDSFANPNNPQPNPERWDLSNPDGHIITQGGDSSGASYLRISLNPFLDGTEVSITSRETFQVPTRVGFGVSISQRIVGQEVFAGLVGCDVFDAVEKIVLPADRQITTSATITSNVATFTLPGHGFKGGDRVTMYGHAQPHLNVGPAVITVADANTFTLPVVLTNGTYVTNGYVQHVDPLAGAKNGAGFLFENTNAGNASFVSRRNGAKFRSTNSTVASTTATQSNTNPHTDAFNSAANQELYFAMDEVSYRSFAADGGGGITGYGKYSQAVPDEDNEYKIQVRAKIMRASTRPIARVVSAVKTGTTTATITTDAPHGLTSSDLVQIYGIKDQTGFPNLGAQTAITVVDATTFTVVIGAATTATSAGGIIWMNEGSVLAPGAINMSAQTIARTGGIITLVGNTTWTGLLPGEYAHVWGLETAARAYEGAYKVLRINGTSLELEAPGTDFASIPTGGGVIKRTDVRLHYARLIDYTRLGVEVLGGKGQTNDVNNAVPVTIAGSATVPITGSVNQGTGQGTATAWTTGGFSGVLVADVASAALTATATTAAVAPGTPGNIGVYANGFNIIVTGVTGTTPTLDVGVEESMDNGVNWVRIYDFPRITANGAYSSPIIGAQGGTRYRYVQTVGGTTPSFTRAINRVQFSIPGALIRQFIDRTINLNTLNATTPVRDADGCNAFQLVVATSAGATTNPVLQLQGSDDGANFYNFGPLLTATPSATVQIASKDTAYPKYVRAIVTTAGVAASLTSVTLRALSS